jgi:hypothetical protein
VGSDSPRVVKLREITRDEELIKMPGDVLTRHNQEEHVIPAELVKDDAARNGFQFVAQHPDVVTPDQHHWPFLVFEKPRPKTEQ